MSLESFNSNSPGIGMGSLPGSYAPIEEGHQATIQDTEHQDTLTVAEQEQLMALYIMAGYPMLPPPSVDYQSNPSLQKLGGAALAGGIAMSFELQLQKIGQQVLDSWSASLQKQADELREYLNSDAYRIWQEKNAPTDQKRVEETTPSAASKLDSQQAEASPIPRYDSSLLSENLARYSTLIKNKDPDAVGALPFAMTSLIIPATISSGILDTVSTRQVAVNPSVDTTVYNNLVNGLPLGAQSDMRAELGLLGALFCMGALNYAEARNTTDALKGEKQHSQKQLAENYADKILTTVNNPNFDKFLAGMLTGKVDQAGNTVTQAQVNERIAIFKLVLLSTALMALYASEAKHITKEDFDGMLNGTTQPRSQKETDLINAFKGVRDSGKINSSTYTLLLQGLQDYADSNPDFKSFFKVDDAFQSISNRIAVQNETAASVPINTPS
jgi:hypothetical protein